MNRDVERALRALDEATEFAKTYRFELSDDYLSLIEAVEAMPQNQSGCDKTGIWRAVRAYRETFKHMQPSRRQS
jgi:hypothetical protein